MTQKKIYLILISVLTVVISLVLFFVGFNLNSRSIAKKKLAEEITSLEKNIEELQAQKEDAQQKLSDIETELSTKNTINNYYMEYKKTHDKLTDEIAELKKQSADLDAQIAKKQSEYESASGISEGKKGKSYTLKKDSIYTCPDKIPAGRYIASGSGKLVISSSAGKVIASPNLDVEYNNSYTFNLSDKEQIKVENDVTITELK